MKKFLLGTSALFLFFFGFSQTADLVLLNGNIVTLEEPGHAATAVAIRAGTIMAVGTNDSIKNFIGDGTKVIVLQGHTVIPGFNDVHQHPAPVYAWDKPYASLRLDTVNSMGSLIRLLKRKAAITPKGMLIRGVGYNEIKLGGNKCQMRQLKPIPGYCKVFECLWEMIDP